jgi:hypothetical protein
MLDIVDNPVLWLTWHVLLIKSWFSNHRAAGTGDQSTSLSRKRRGRDWDRDVRRRLHSWDSVFGKDILLNSNIQNPQHPDGEKFRLRFRVPYSVFAGIVQMFVTREGWNPFGAHDRFRKPSHPIQIKILWSLFILGRGTDLDTVSMLSHISIGSLSQFFHHFCEKMASIFQEYICMPTGNDLKAVVARYTRMGFPGCVGSTDCVHFYWDRCPHNARHLYLGKEGKPTVAYSMIVDHNRRIRSLTVGNPGARNDKSIIQYDKSIQDIRSQSIYQDEKFTLYTSDGESKIHRGLYLLCGNGHHKWRPMQCPNKYASETNAARWSERVESVRKDSEFTFGILKKRWRILRDHMLIQSKAKIDNIVFTCAILHNMLIDFDEWSAADDEYDIIEDLEADLQEEEMDSRIENLSREPVDRSYTGGLDIQENEVEYETEWFTLRKSLIEHYAVCFRLGQIEY